MLPSLKELTEIKHKLCMCGCFVCLQDAGNRTCGLFIYSTSFSFIFSTEPWCRSGTPPSYPRLVYLCILSSRGGLNWSKNNSILLPGTGLGFCMFPSSLHWVTRINLQDASRKAFPGELPEVIHAPTGYVELWYKVWNCYSAFDVNMSIKSTHGGGQKNNKGMIRG